MWNLNNLLWPPKARPLYFNGVIYLFFFYFVSIDERPAMGSQPNLLEVVSIYKCPTNVLGAPPLTLTTFFTTSALGTTYLRNKTSHRQTKSKCQSTMCPWKVTYFPWPLTQKRLRSVGSWWPTIWKFSIFSSLPCFPHKGHWTQANQIVPDVRGLKGLTIHCKNFGKIQPPKNSHPAYVVTFGQHVFRDFRTQHRIAISPERNVASNKKQKC